MDFKRLFGTTERSPGAQFVSDITADTVILDGKKTKLLKSPEAESKEGGSQVEQKSSLVLDELPCGLAALTRSVAQPFILAILDWLTCGECYSTTD